MYTCVYVCLYVYRYLYRYEYICISSKLQSGSRSNLSFNFSNSTIR